MNPNTIGVMETIGPQDVSSFEPTTPAILWSSYNGQRKGEALADVLLGTYNPSGRTPETWYQNVEPDPPSVYSYAIRPGRAERAARTCTSTARSPTRSGTA